MTADVTAYMTFEDRRRLIELTEPERRYMAAGSNEILVYTYDGVGIGIKPINEIGKVNETEPSNPASL